MGTQAAMGDKKDEEMERAFKICLEGKGDSLTKDQLYNYLCALGLTPTQKEVDDLPASANLEQAKEKNEELNKVENRAFTEEQVAEWFQTWDAQMTGKIPLSKLEGPVEGVTALSADEIKQLKDDEAGKIGGDGLWDYRDYLQFMVANQNMKLST